MRGRHWNDFIVHETVHTTEKFFVARSHVILTMQAEGQTLRKAADYTLRKRSVVSIATKSTGSDTVYLSEKNLQPSVYRTTWSSKADENVLAVERASGLQSRKDMILSELNEFYGNNGWINTAEKTHRKLIRVFGAATIRCRTIRRTTNRGRILRGNDFS